MYNTNTQRNVPCIRLTGAAEFQLCSSHAFCACRMSIQSEWKTEYYGINHVSLTKHTRNRETLNY